MECKLGVARISCDKSFGCAECEYYVAEEGEMLVFDLDKVRELFKRYSDKNGDVSNVENNC